MLYPLLRVNRAISSILIAPEHPIQAVAVSEIVSFVAPLLNPSMYTKTLSALIAMIYMPQFSLEILNIHYKRYIIYNQAEMCCILLFITTYGIQYLHANSVI